MSNEMTKSEELYELATEFGCPLAIAKAEFTHVDIDDAVLEEMCEAFETLNGYREDFPGDLLSGMRELAGRALRNIYKKALAEMPADEWPSLG